MQEQEPPKHGVDLQLAPAKPPRVPAEHALILVQQGAGRGIMF